MAQCIITPDSNYNYCPSFAAAILFASLFGLSTGTHLVQAIVYRKKFCWVIVMGGLWETGGFAVRALSSRNIASIAPVTVSQLLILLSPLWINAFDYMILGRVVHYYLPSKKIWIRADRLALCFVLLDITAFLIQAAGGSMASSDNPPKTIQLGLHIYMGGIGFQEFFLFISKITIYFFTEISNKIGNTGRPTHWKPLLTALLATLTLITIRIIYRLVEFSQGISSTLTNHEAFFYVLEATPMIIGFTVLNIWHPGRFLVGPDSEFPKKRRNPKNLKSPRRQQTTKVMKPGTVALRFCKEKLGNRPTVMR
ncbi:RTA1 like protein-domain-containing protein [Mycena floridula]|nr:RTA1 like protein-domain-containing protein [Mycena floridula]